MMETQNYWEDNSAHSMQVKYESLDGRSCKDEIYRMGLGSGYCEGNLNFATASEDDEVYTKKKVSRQDPMSHRIIEKRRRDRMNNCLADLSRLIPAEYLKKGRGRVEKTEIIEMAIRHMKYLQGLRQDSKQHHAPVSSVHHAEDSVDSSMSHPSPPSSSSSSSASASEHYRLGYQECLSETMHFLVEVEGFFARDALIVQLVSHLQQHCSKVLASSDRLGFPHPVDLATGNSTGCSSDIVFNHANGGIPSMCSNGNGLTGSGLGLLSSNNNNNSSTNNHNLNGTSNGHSQQQHPLLHNNSNSSSDRCSSSGVSSYDPSESKPCQRPLIPPPTLTSDDSNHSSHSHGSSAGCYPSGGVIHLPSHAEGGRQQPSNYKFKNSIKQRFSADQRIKSSCSPPPSGQLVSNHENCPSRNGQASQHQQQNQGVPIFALHDNGGFYIPLTLEASVLRPHLGYSNADVGPETVLHPVTISVNFNHSTHNPQQQSQHQQQPASSWSSHPSPAHQVQ